MLIKQMLSHLVQILGHSRELWMLPWKNWLVAQELVSGR
uniref:Excision repair cross-complementing 1 ercc1, putative n=1 Tax=Arundo donax TaxID=35708 RepID=A0A0A9DLK1_ARUDO